MSRHREALCYSPAPRKRRRMSGVGGRMPGAILDGKRIGAELRRQAAEAAARLSASGPAPGLAAVLVGEDPASQVYVRSKTAAAREAGIAERTLRFPAD